MIDLRSDTVTRPGAAMRAAMAEAPVGDDQYGEDATTNLLQDRFAALFGKEAALFLPSGTMTNQAALSVLTRPGDDVLLADEAHIVWHETGAAAANSGVQFRVIGRGGIFDGDDVRRAALARGHMVFPPTTLVVVENTHNRAGGVIFPDEAARSVVAAAAELGLATYLDGARIFNVAAATGQPVSELAAGFDLVGVSLSKGLGCPCGSMLAGSARLIDAARRARRRFGGALRQSGILAAAGLYALDNNITRLATDHRNARLIAEALAGTPGIRLDLSSVQTNIVLFHLDRTGSAKEVVGRARERGVLIADFSPQTIRLATHHDVDEAQCREAADVLRSILRELA